MKNNIITLTALVAISALSNQVAAAPLASGWTSSGNAGTTIGTDGVVITPTGFTGYNWVSTDGGVSGNTLGYTGSTNGSTALSPLFSAAAGEQLAFKFNYITSDGAGYSDYGWAKLFDSSMNEVALLFTARTTPTGNTVPGFGMSPINAAINPAVVTITAGAPDWSSLGSSSGTCFSTGCGYTGWVDASYLIASAGTFHLQLGVANFTDTAWDSGLAFAGATIAGKSIDDVSQVPLPPALVLFASGLLGLGVSSRKKRS